MNTKVEDRVHWKLLFAIVGEIRQRAATTDGMKMEMHTIAQARTFSVIADSYPNGTSLKEIAKKRGITAGTASLGVDALVRAGMVKREREVVAGDRRVVRLLPTAKAMRRIAHLNNVTGKVVKSAFAGVSKTDQEAYGRVLLKICENLGLA